MIFVRWIKLVVLYSAASAQFAFSQDTILDGNSATRPGISVASPEEVLVAEALINPTIPSAVLDSYRVAQVSLGDLVDWNFADEAEKIGIMRSSAEVDVLSKAVATRRLDQEKNLRSLEATVSAIQLNSQEKDRGRERKEAELRFTKEEVEAEDKLAEVVDEVLTPTQYKSLVRHLIKGNYQRIGGSRMLCHYLNLTSKQIDAFEKLRQFRPSKSGDADGSEFIKLLIAAEITLDRNQTEEYWIATGRMSDNESLESFFVRLPAKRRQDLCRYSAVFRDLEAQNSEKK